MTLPSCPSRSTESRAASSNAEQESQWRIRRVTERFVDLLIDDDVPLIEFPTQSVEDERACARAPCAREQQKNSGAC